MIYISKGILKNSLSNADIQVGHNGLTHHLKKKEAELWVQGSIGFAYAKNAIEEHVLINLEKIGVVELEHEEQDISKYRLLTRCICCATVKKYIPLSLKRDEKRLYTWICKAGLRLSMAELTYLMEYYVVPLEFYLGEENRQHLVERIYIQRNIADNLLEIQMEHAIKRDDTVRIIEQLIKKKYIMLM